MPVTLAIIGGVAGLGQTIGGMIQRKRGEKAAEAQIGKLGPDQGIMSYYNQALQRYGVSPAQTALYKRQMQNIARLQSGGLRKLQQSGNVLAGVPGIIDAGSQAALNAEVAAEQQQNLRFGQLGTAAQLAAAEKRRPEEIKLQMQLQKAAGGSQVANAGLSNIFSALQTGAMASMYGGGTGKSVSEFPKGYKKGVTTGMLNLFPTPETTVPSRISTASGLIPRATPSAAMRRSYVPSIPSGSSYPGSIYPFPTYPY